MVLLLCLPLVPSPHVCSCDPSNSAQRHILQHLCVNLSRCAHLAWNKNFVMNSLHAHCQVSLFLTPPCSSSSSHAGHLYMCVCICMSVYMCVFVCVRHHTYVQIRGHLWGVGYLFPQWIPGVELRLSGLFSALYLLNHKIKTLLYYFIFVVLGTEPKLCSC